MSVINSRGEIHHNPLLSIGRQNYQMDGRINRKADRRIEFWL